MWKRYHGEKPRDENVETLITNFFISRSRTGAQAKGSGSMAVERDLFQREGIPSLWHFQQALVSRSLLLAKATAAAEILSQVVAWAKHSFCEV